jgi:cellulase
VNTATWGSDVLIRQNNSWTVNIPSDIKPGKYVVRHEIIALQFANKGTPDGVGSTNTGAQFYPICANIEVIGSGMVTPSGVKFPGGYSPRDSGILKDIYSGKICYTTIIEVTNA